jgi:hypothetical protein
MAHRSPPLQEGRIRGCRTRGAPEHFVVGRRGPEPWYTWRRRSPSYQEGGIWSHWTHGSPGAHLDWKAESGATGHVGAHPVPCLDLKFACRGTRFVGYQQVYSVSGDSDKKDEGCSRRRRKCSLAALASYCQNESRNKVW